MSNTSFIKQKWTIEDDPHTVSGRFSIKAGDYVIAIVPDLGFADNEAHAQFIAAAPELLQALTNYTQVIEKFLEGMPDEFVVDLITGSVVQMAHKQAKAAIAKATGDTTTDYHHPNNQKSTAI